MHKPTNLPWIAHRIPSTDAEIGGAVMICTAAAALKLGDVVYLSGTRTVNKSATVGNHALVCGVVVGGTNTGMQADYNAANYNSIVAADANEQVLVQYNGIALVICKAAITIGRTVIPDTTDAGKVKDSAVLTSTVGTLVVDSGATPVTSTAANGAIISGAPAVAGDGFFRAVGKLLQASGADGDIRPCLLTIGA